MSKKHKAPDNPADCLTIDQQVAYSLRLLDEYERIVNGYNSKPSDLLDFYDKYPTDESMPWTSPSFAADWARSEREKQRALRRLYKQSEIGD
jgi:hypothetical protein